MISLCSQVGFKSTALAGNNCDFYGYGGPANDPRIFPYPLTPFSEVQRSLHASNHDSNFKAETRFFQSRASAYASGSFEGLLLGSRIRCRSHSIKSYLYLDITCVYLIPTIRMTQPEARGNLARAFSIILLSPTPSCQAYYHALLI